LDLRRRLIAPRLVGLKGSAGRAIARDGAAFIVAWRLGDGSRLILAANLSNEPQRLPEQARSHLTDIPAASLIHETPTGAFQSEEAGMQLPAWSAVFLLEPAGRRE
jgi:hypothetical protein